LGAGVWAGLFAAIALLGLGGWAALQVALATVEDGPIASAAGAPEPSGTSRGIVVASSQQPPSPAGRPPSTDRPNATPSDWFATATARQSAVARDLSDELAARSLADGPRGGQNAQPSPTPRSGPAPTGAAPPPPIDVAAARATAVAAAAGPAPTRTPRPAATRTATRTPIARANVAEAVATPTPEPDDSFALAAARVEPPTAARVAEAIPTRVAVATPTRIAGRDVVATRVAQAARQAPTRTSTYQRRVPQWTPRAAGPTPTLGPTQTPRPRQTPVSVATRSPFTPPTVKNGANKWGVGVYRDSNRVLDVIREAQPGVILLMDPGEGWARKVREAAPNAFIVGRRYKREDDQPLDKPAERGEEMADWVAEVAVPVKGVVDAWMSYNEVVGHDDFDDYKRYNDFQVAFAHRLQDVYGIAAVAGNDGSGAVEPADYPRYFAEAIRASQYFGLHAYSPPATSRMDVDAEWNALRYRKVHDALEQAGIHGKQMVMTESGLGDGFRNGVASDEQMATDFAWFTRELRQDSYVIGQAAFGLFDDTGAWDRFELTDSNVPKLVPPLLR
jgi:hypothetical protein